MMFMLIFIYIDIPVCIFTDIAYIKYMNMMYSSIDVRIIIEIGRIE